MKSDDLIFRQINSSFVQNGRVTSQAFRPTPKDEKKLSAYDGSMISAEKAFEHYTTTLELNSVGVMGLTQEECSGNGLPVVPDPEPFPEHVLLDFTPYENGPITRMSKTLKAIAEARGWLHKV
ncbi:hypothetical protein PU683_05805 [Kosakonia cowanii]|uniref:hypothetical protein n=1 Tax=Kosakonia cowanii TaxID=208223 RepID=UPI0023F8BCCC|nr:hypothetical protein [Kosakonia cowanii]MDF7759045.1 hypothetical protein [Kosakonia cowanii]